MLTLSTLYLRFNNERKRILVQILDTAAVNQHFSDRKGEENEGSYRPYICFNRKYSVASVSVVPLICVYVHRSADAAMQVMYQPAHTRLVLLDVCATGGLK